MGQLLKTIRSDNMPNSIKLKTAKEQKTKTNKQTKKRTQEIRILKYGYVYQWGKHLQMKPGISSVAKTECFP